MSHKFDPNGRRVLVEAQLVGLLRTVELVLALDQVRTKFPILAIELAPAVTIDGLPGLTFFRGHVLQLDFIRGMIDVDPEKQKPRPWWRFWR